MLSATVGYAAEILEETAKKDVFTTGASQILKMPEYRDLDKAHDLMTFFVDNKENLPVPEDDTPLKILIGPENVNEALRDTSVVVASYDIGDGMRGLVGVVGPTRMDYATVTARLSYFADSLTRMFGKKASFRPRKRRSKKCRRRISRTHSPRPPEKEPQAAAAEEGKELPPRIRREEAKAETFTVTREQMEKMEGLAKQLAEEHDQYLRLAAEYDNYRKRTAKEKGRHLRQREDRHHQGYASGVRQSRARPRPVRRGGRRSPQEGP